MPQCSVLHVQPSHSRRCSFPKLNIPGCSPSPSVTPHCATARPISCPKMEGLSFGLSWWDASRFLPPWMHAGAGDGSPVPCLSQPLCSFFLSEVAAFAQGVGVEQGGGGCCLPCVPGPASHPALGMCLWPQTRLQSAQRARELLCQSALMRRGPGVAGGAAQWCHQGGAGAGVRP